MTPPAQPNTRRRAKGNLPVQAAPGLASDSGYFVARASRPRVAQRRWFLYPRTTRHERSVQPLSLPAHPTYTRAFPANHPA